MPEAEDIRLTDVLRALSDPGRVRMLAVLSDGLFHACNVEEFGLDIQKSTLSHHFKTMREAGLTEVRVQGRNHDIRLRAAELEARFPGLVEALTSPAALADLQREA
jgi:DNA-binding transcriptional ArsR family regulator